jgi:hypothetical protein
LRSNKALLRFFCPLLFARAAGCFSFSLAAQPQKSPPLLLRLRRNFFFLCFGCVVRSVGELGTVGQLADFSGDLATIRGCGLGDCSADFRTNSLRNNSAGCDLPTAMQTDFCNYSFTAQNTELRTSILHKIPPAK